MSDAAIALKERPILFSAPMVRALLAGTKTQTRRIIKPQPVPIKDATMERTIGGPFFHNDFVWHRCAGVTTISNKPNGPDHWARDFSPYGRPGDRLWVRETFYLDLIPYSDGGPLPAAVELDDWRNNLYYRADGECCEQIAECSCAEIGKPAWRPSIHMPRWASRLTLEIADVRVERLQDISEQDAQAEGVERNFVNRTLWHNYSAPKGFGFTAKDSYESLWESINGPGSWEENPWVWVISFKRVTP